MNRALSIAGANLGAGFSYVLAAYIGWELSSSPFSISPLWPPAGVALGMLLLHGRAVLPGIALAILWVKLESFIGVVDASAFARSLPAALAGAAGALLQAWVGAELITRRVGRNDPLIDNGRIVRFLLLAGPISCLIGATLGAAGLLLGGVISRAELPLTWLNWWGGDSIGAITVAPMLLILFAEPRAIWRWRIKSVLLPLLAVLVAVTFLFHYSYRQHWYGMMVEYERQIDLLHAALADNVDDEIERNHALKAFFDGTEQVTEHEFEIFASALLQRATGINALEWIPRVPHAARAEFENGWLGAGTIREPAPYGGMVPAAPQDEYFPIRYLVPYRGNEAARGYNVRVNAGAAAAIAAARDSGRMQASPPIRLIQDPERVAGTVLYAPVYAGATDLPTTESRRARFRGVVASVFRVTDRIESIRAAAPDLQLELVLRDGDEVLYQRAPAQPPLSVAGRLLRYREIAVGERVWIANYRPTTEFLQSNFLADLWWLLLGSFAFTGLAGAGLLLLTGVTLRTERLVAERTRELQIESEQRRRMIEMRELQNEVLAQIAGQEPLEQVLESLVRKTEAANPGLICSIHLLDADKRRFNKTIAPSMPESYGTAVGGVDVGPGVGSCGTAAATGQRVIVPDVFAHPYWRDFTDLARSTGIHACWSEPIIADREILGSFALYHRHPREPDATELEFIHDLAALVSIAVMRRRSESQIERLAFYDVLTELPNRRLLLDRLEVEIASASRHGCYGALLYIDLDNFKTLNDSKGHFVGDLLLIQVAERLRACIRREDIAARLGGDEFVVLLREEDPDMARLSDRVMVLARRIQAALNRPYDLNGYMHLISPSIGITFFSRDVNSPNDVLKQADTAMYSAKARGRNAISFYHPDMQKHVDERLVLERDLRGALDADQFRLLYQPQIGGDLKLRGAEALLRWQHPERGLVPPDAFIPLTEENRLIIPIGAWVLEQACLRLEQWPWLGHLAVNISPVQLQDADFLPDLRRQLAAHPGAAGRLVLEMTESIMIGDVHATAAVLRGLRELGVGISIDDFGKGYSSLGYLRMLPISQLKVDKSFVNDIAEDASGNVIVETIIAMAQHLKLEVIAEGVETRQQLGFLQEQGCTGFQGYYFGRPVAPEEFARTFGDTAPDPAA